MYIGNLIEMNSIYMDIGNLIEIHCSYMDIGNLIQQLHIYAAMWLSYMYITDTYVGLY